MNKRLISRFRLQKGFTLIELLIALTIVAVIGTALAATITQLIVVQAANKNHTQVIDQVQNALHYINRDAQMAWPSQITLDNSISYPESFPLILRWTDFTSDNTPVHIVTYSLNNNGDLLRSETVNGNPQPAITVARDIDGAASSYSYDSTNRVLTVTLTSTINAAKTASETRTLQVQLRTTN